MVWASSVTRRFSVAAAAALTVVTAAVTAPTLARADTTYSETTGVVTHTWTNYLNAGGTEGPTIPAFTTVQIACALTGFRVANGNTWWYKIASSPWNGNFYASADPFYNNGATSGPLKGTPYVDPAVPICGAAPPPPPPPPPSAAVALAQGPAAPHGYRYAITLQHFPANSDISANCYDSKSPSGFYPFIMHTDGAGNAFTQSQCFSGDGPDHWVIAGGVASNHVTWSGSSGGGGGQPPGGGGTGGGQAGGGSGGETTQAASSNKTSVFYSPNDTATGVPNVTAGDINLKLSEWSEGGCKTDKADDFDGPNVSVLAGWSVGRLGPIYFLSTANKDRVAKIRTIMLFDPGSTSDFANPPIWKRVAGKSTCDWRLHIDTLLASWLDSNRDNHLMIFTGHDSEMKEREGDQMVPKYRGLWEFYLAAIWNKPFANRAQVCDYDEMTHEDVLKNFAKFIKSPVTSCPDGPKRTAWHP